MAPVRLMPALLPPPLLPPRCRSRCHSSAAPTATAPSTRGSGTATLRSGAGKAPSSACAAPLQEPRIRS